MTGPRASDIQTDSIDVPEAVPHHSMRSRVRNYFLTGLVVAGPLAITIYLIWSFVTWVDDLVRPFIPPAFRPENYLPIKIPGFGLIIAFVALTLLGFLTANLVGRTLVEFGERILGRMPIVRPLYRGLKQVFETLFAKSGSTFRTVALVEFPAPGMWSLVFLSTPPGADIAVSLPGEQEYVSVFMPCTPNPTTGGTAPGTYKGYDPRLYASPPQGTPKTKTPHNHTPSGGGNGNGNSGGGSPADPTG